MHKGKNGEKMKIVQPLYIYIRLHLIRDSFQEDADKMNVEFNGYCGSHFYHI